MLLFNKQQQQTRVSSSRTSENVVETVDSVSIRNLIRSFVGGLLSLSYTVTLYPFVRLTKWWLSFVKLVIYDSPKLLTKKTSQYLMRYDWVQKLTLPWLKLIFVDLFRVADKDVSNYLRLDVEKLRAYNRKKEPGQLREKKNLSLVTTSENLAERITPAVKNVSEKVSSNLEKIPEKLQQVSLPFVSKLTTATSQVDEKSVSLNKEKMDSLEKQVNHLNLIISKQTSKSEKLKESQKNKIKADLDKYEMLRKDKDELLHEKNRLEHTTLSQLQMMQEVQVMLNNQAKKIHEFESLKEHLNDQVHNLQKENMNLKNDLNIEKEHVKKIHSEIDKWKNLKENVDHQLILVNRQLHTLGEENNQLRERKFVLEKNQKEHSQRLDAVEKIKQDFHDINIKLAQKDDELSELNDQMKKKVKENELLKNQLGDLDSELKKMSLDYSNLKKSQKQPIESKEEEIVKEELPIVKQEEAKKVEQKEKPLPKVKEEKVSKKATLPAEEEKLEDQFEIVKEFESDRIKPEKPSQVESKKVEPKKQVAKPKESLKTDKQEAEAVKQVELKKDKEEPELEKQEQKPLSRRKSQQQIPAAAIKGEPAELESQQVYQAKDNYVEELNFILDDIEKGEIENVQFHSIITNPKLEGSLVKLDPEQIDDLCDVLENSDNVSFVDFSDCGMDNSLTEKILSSLSKNNSIEVIDLANNKVNPDELVDSVVNFIAENKKCNKLLMKDWKFSNDKFSKIIHALQFRNNSLVDFKVDESDLSEEDHKLLHQALHNNISK